MTRSSRFNAERKPGGGRRHRQPIRVITSHCNALHQSQFVLIFQGLFTATNLAPHASRHARCRFETAAGCRGHILRRCLGLIQHPSGGLQVTKQHWRSQA